MKNSKWLNTILFLSVAVVIAGCSATGSEQQSNIGKASCTAQKTSINPETLTIEGGVAAKPGEPVRYSLSEDFSCSENQTVAWRTVAGGTRLGTNDETAFVSSFRKSGEYVVAAQVTSADSATTYEVSTKTVIDDNVALVGPEFGMAEVETKFSLAIPAGSTIVSASWNFGDGSGAVNSLAPQTHYYMTAGDFIVQVTATFSDGTDAVLAHTIHVLPPTDGMECVVDLATSGPTEGIVGTPVTLSVYIPQCLSWRVGSVRWTFGDGTPTGSSQTVQHTYAHNGNYEITVELFDRNNPNTPLLTLHREIDITGEGSPEEPEVPEEPTIPHECSILGQTRDSQGEIYTEEVA